MALVLRKAVLPKNVTLFKCIRGRPLATTAKKNPAPLSSLAKKRGIREQIKGILDIPMVKVTEAPFEKPETTRNTYNVYKSMSCPAFSYLDLQLELAESLPKSQSTSNLEARCMKCCQHHFGHSGNHNQCYANNAVCNHMHLTANPKQYSTSAWKEKLSTAARNHDSIDARNTNHDTAAASTTKKKYSTTTGSYEENCAGVNSQLGHAAMACMPICCQPFHNPLPHTASAWHPQQNCGPCSFSAPCHPNWEGAYHVGASMNPSPGSICQPLYCPAVTCNPMQAPQRFVDPFSQICNVCGCPCPCPCGAPGGPPCPCSGGNCLPPPCNVPAKCLQSMTGYYYYPYGTWFCGPYHVSTGNCPCTGPVTPGGPCCPNPPPCGPCGPCCGPCGPCGPCCGPCGPCGPCCGPCGPCGCCGPCSFCGPCPCGPLPCGPVSPTGPADPSKLTPPSVKCKKESPANIDAIDCFCKASLAARVLDNNMKNAEVPTKAATTTPIYSNPNIIKGFPYNKIKPMPIPNASISARATAMCFSTLIPKSNSCELYITRKHTTKIRNGRKPHKLFANGD